METSEDGDENSSLPNGLITVAGKYAFREGESFDSYEKLLDRMNQHSKESLVYYWRRDSRTVQKAYTKTTRPIASRLRYYLVRFACIYGGMKNQSGKRKLTSGKPKRTDCPAYVLLRASKCGGKLEVVSVCNDHNHEISAQEAQKLPQNRRLSEEVREEVIEMLKLKVDRKKIIEYVQQRDDKTVTTKDLLNLAARLKGVEAGPLEPEKRAQILQRIAHFVLDPGIQTIISKELNQPLLDSDDSIDFEIDDSTLIEYISPEHEFDVNETIIDSIVEARRRDSQMDFIEKIWTASEFINSANIECVSPLILDDGDDKNMFSVKEDDDDIDDLVSFHPTDEDNRIFDTTNMPDVTGDSAFVVYDDFPDCTDSDAFNGTGDSNGGMAAISPPIDNSIVIFETTTDVKVEDILNGIETGDDDGANGSLPTTTFFDVIQTNGIHETANQFTDRSPAKTKKTNNNNKHIKRAINRTGRKLTNCRNCGTNFRLLKAQIGYLRAKRNKMLAETEMLRLKRKELICDIKRLSNM